MNNDKPMITINRFGDTVITNVKDIDVELFEGSDIKDLAEENLENYFDNLLNNNNE